MDPMESHILATKEADTPTHFSQNKWYKIFGLLILIVVASVLYFLNIFNLNNRFEIPYLSTQNTKSAPQGSLYMSLTPVNGNHTGVYQYNFSTNTLKKYFVNDNLVYFTPRFYVEQHEKIVFSSNLDLNRQYEGKDMSMFQIYEKSFSSPGFVQKTFLETPYSKRAPVFGANTNDLFYTGFKLQKPTPEQFIDIKNWGIYRVSASGTESFFAEGTHPELSPDGSALISLRSDGLYVTDLTNNEVSQVWPLDEGEATANMQIDVSKSGDKIAWSNIMEGKVYVFSVNAWKPFMMSKIIALDTKGFWPVFSPDGKYLAFEEVDMVEGVPENQRLVVFNLESFEKKTILDLTPFKQTSLYVDDWVLE